MVTLVTHWLTPHYSNNHRPKLLHPAGLTVVVALFLLIHTSLQLSRLAPALPGGFVLGYASSITPSQVIELTNSERTKLGLPPLQLDNRLSQAAAAKAAHMFQHDYWAHVAPDGTTPWVFIKNAGYTYSVAGENLARDFNDSSSMVQAWMNSPTHKDNIVHSKYTQIGVAVVDGKLQGVETTLVVQMFGNPTAAQARTTNTSAKATTPVDSVAPQPTAIPEEKPVEVNELTFEEPQVLAVNRNESLHIISPLLVSKVVASSLIILLVLVLTYDTVATSKKRLTRRVGNNWAHIGLFSVILLVILAMAQGKVL